MYVSGKIHLAYACKKPWVGFLTWKKRREGRKSLSSFWKL